MKKFLAVLLTLAVLSFCSISLAESETADTYLFRSIPWYSAKSDAVESLTGLDSYSNRSNASCSYVQILQNHLALLAGNICLCSFQR